MKYKYGVKMTGHKVEKEKPLSEKSLEATSKTKQEK